VFQCRVRTNYYLKVTLKSAVTRTGTLVQVADYPAGAAFGPRNVNEYEFIWLLRGSANWRVEPTPGRPLAGAGLDHTLRPGTLALAHADTVDSYQWDRRRASSHAYVHFDIEDPEVLGPPAQWPVTRDLSRLPVLAGLCDYLLQLAGQQGELARRRSDQLIAILLDLFVRGPLEPQAQMPPVVERIVDYVRTSWDIAGPRILNVDELAGAASVSPGHVFRVFREQYGCGPARAFELMRLARAAIALQRSNASLSEIAELNGFANAYHLSRRFAATYGSPPGRYRASGAGEDPLLPVREHGLLPLSLSLTR
jgi:AraC family transcriptional regulator